MKLFDVYPLFDVNIVKGKGCKVWTTRVRSISTSMAGMPLSASDTRIRTISRR